MFFVKLIVVVCACVILQVQCSVSTCNDKASDKRDPLVTANSAMTDLEKIVSAVVEIALNAISGLETSLKIIQKYVMNVTKDLIYQVEDDIIEKLNEMKEDAYAIEVDVIDCVEDREEDLKQLPVVFLNRTSECAVERVNEMLDSFSDIALDVQSANEVVKNLTDQLEHCGNDIRCIDKMTEEINKAISEVPETVKADINKAQQKIDELLNYLFECEHDNYNQLQITAQEIFNGIVECVEGKLLNATTVSTP